MKLFLQVAVIFSALISAADTYAAEPNDYNKKVVTSLVETIIVLSEPFAIIPEDDSAFKMQLSKHGIDRALNGNVIAIMQFIKKSPDTMILLRPLFKSNNQLVSLSALSIAAEVGKHASAFTTDIKRIMKEPQWGEFAQRNILRNGSRALKKIGTPETVSFLKDVKKIFAERNKKRAEDKAQKEAAYKSSSPNEWREIQLDKITKNIANLTVAYNTFRGKYNGLPGDLTKATSFLSSKLTNGNGNGRIDGNDPSQVMEQLVLAGMISEKPTSKLKNVGYRIQYYDSGKRPSNAIFIGSLTSNGDYSGGAFTYKEAMKIGGQTRIVNGKGQSSCTIENKNSTEKSCALVIPFR